jgi:hypothetical protein
MAELEIGSFYDINVAKPSSNKIRLIDTNIFQTGMSSIQEDMSKLRSKFFDVLEVFKERCDYASETENQVALAKIETKCIVDEARSEIKKYSESIAYEFQMYVDGVIAKAIIKYENEMKRIHDDYELP